VKNEDSIYIHIEESSERPRLKLLAAAVLFILGAVFSFALSWFNVFLH
jgi:hypothetical protein